MELSHMAKIVIGIIFALIVIIVGVLGWGYYELFGPGYYAELRSVEAKFQEISGVEVLKIHGNEDITLEDIWAQIHVEEKGRMTFWGLTRDSFKNTPHIHIGKIGSYMIRVEGKGYVGAYDNTTKQPVQSKFSTAFIDIGSEGEFSHLFSFAVSNIHDVIAHYDEICAVLARWPVYPEMAHFQAQDGTDYYYSVTLKTDSQQ